MRWFDTDYQLDSFERSIAGKVFYAETFPDFSPNLGPSVYSAFYAGRLEFAEGTSWYEPVLTDLDDWSVLQRDPFESLYFKQLEQMTRAAQARCHDRYWVRRVHEPDAARRRVPLPRRRGRPGPRQHRTRAAMVMGRKPGSMPQNLLHRPNQAFDGVLTGFDMRG